MLSNNPRNLRQYSEVVWLTKPYSAGKNQDCFIGVCIRQDDGSFASIDALRMDADGIYYFNKMKLGTLDSPAFKFYIEQITKKLTAMSREDQLFDDVSKYYLEKQSIKQTAKAFDLSEQRVRKILITKGVFTSDLQDQIQKMISGGKSADEISETLHMPKKQVMAYLPYD